MKTTERGSEKTFPRVLRSLTIPALMIALAVLPASAIEAAEQEHFPSPEEAVETLISALGENDTTELRAILGPESEDLISSGDPIADQNGRSRFLRAYQEMHRLEEKGAGSAVLHLGERDYPFPIPIVRQGTEWRFDTAAGKEEILNRRIGRNELHTVEVMQAYTEAQREYACLKINGGGQEFARKLSSSEGKKDGLYWEAREGERESPLGPLIARAVAKGYTGVLNEEAPEPFQGYYFKILLGQGPHAEGGAFDYLAEGRMVLGFALIAYPARYGASGIMTFIVNQTGVVYEKDLGKETATEAAAITLFDPDDSWRRHQPPAVP